MKSVVVLGGYQTDFARNLQREGRTFADLLEEAACAGLDTVKLDPSDVGVIHVANFAGELYCRQAQLGAVLGEVAPAFAGIPAVRHEAACASGAVSVLAAAADIEAGRYDLALVLGIEVMKTVDPRTGGDYLGTAAWYEREARGVDLPFLALFSQLGDEYEARYGLRDEHLAAIAEINLRNAQRNPHAQTREWSTDSAAARERSARPVTGRLRVRDCAPITDGAVSLLLASERFAQEYAATHDLPLQRLPRLLGWGHRTAPIGFATKLRASRELPYVFPETRRAILDAFRRAAVADVWGLDAIETHDCFTTSEYMAIDHFGLTDPGESWRAIEDGTIAFGGRLPVNPSGGLLGVGHPVGATGVRQALDAWRQVTNQADAYQVPGARRVGTLNIGGTATTSVALVIGV